MVACLKDYAVDSASFRWLTPVVYRPQPGTVTTDARVDVSFQTGIADIRYYRVSLQEMAPNNTFPSVAEMKEISNNAAGTLEHSTFQRLCNSTYRVQARELQAFWCPLYQKFVLCTINV